MFIDISKSKRFAWYKTVLVYWLFIEIEIYMNLYPIILN